MSDSLKKVFIFKNDNNISRRYFLKGVVITGVALHIPIIFSCENLTLSNRELNRNNIKTLDQVLNILLPDDGFGPSATDLNSISYIINSLKDPQFSQKDFMIIKEGFIALDKFAHVEYSSDFSSQNLSAREKIIQKISSTKWGENWLSKIITFILESLLSHPLYGSNTNEIGWKWLNHYSGQPQPNEKLIYPQILQSLNIK
jgi:gluconate 2-dehydrogenase gamma chain